jgi:hypothetical protein
MKTYFSMLVLVCILFTQCTKNEPQVITEDEFFDYTLDGAAYHFTPAVDTFTVTAQPLFGTSISIMYVSCFRRLAGIPGYIILTCAQSNAIPGSYPSSLPCEVNAMGISQNSIQVIQTSYASTVGEYFEGTFSGSFTTTGITHTISGSFRAKRNY